MNSTEINGTRYDFDEANFDATTFTELRWTGRQRDDYGRSYVTLVGKGSRTLVTLITLPKSYREAYGKSHLINLHFMRAENHTTYTEEHTSIGDAKHSAMVQARMCYREDEAALIESRINERNFLLDHAVTTAVRLQLAQAMLPTTEANGVLYDRLQAVVAELEAIQADVLG